MSERERQDRTVFGAAGAGLLVLAMVFGWREVGRFPGGVRVGPGDARDEIWYFREL